ncbi:YpjP family protein [Bacillus sp. FJAT-47783]|uniref:YpjP family protein n=1 Tax=Bacillus sp. FJAT-47783 TaxID=2922712 RepID=UPI001FADB3EF|nr:YpjP family protein [Bacillus sp. FJAT-47783]
MKKWVRKSLVVLFTIATFGLVTPPAALTADENQSVEPQSASISSDKPLVSESFEDQRAADAIQEMVYKAKEQSFAKFGGRIGPVIEDEFSTIILPKMEEVLTAFLEKEQEQFEKVVISEKPTGGKSEKIFHIYDEKSGQDLLRFHVRIDHPPQEGYWFNFHYHTYHDQFEAHYELGTIFWNHNTPPNWMTH